MKKSIVLAGISFIGILLACTSCREAGAKLSETVIIRCSSDDCSFLFLVNDEPVYWNVEFGSVELQGYPLRNGTNELRCVLSACEDVQGQPLNGRVEIVVVSNDEVKEFREFNKTLPEKGEVIISHTFSLSNVKESDVLQEVPAMNDQSMEVLCETVLDQIKYLSEREFAVFAETLPPPANLLFVQALPRWIMDTPANQLNINAIVRKENMVVVEGKRLVLIHPAAPIRELFRMTLEKDDPVLKATSFGYSCMRYSRDNHSWTMWAP